MERSFACLEVLLLQSLKKGCDFGIILSIHLKLEIKPFDVGTEGVDQSLQEHNGIISHGKSHNTWRSFFFLDFLSKGLNPLRCRLSRVAFASNFKKTTHVKSEAPFGAPLLVWLTTLA